MELKYKMSKGILSLAAVGILMVCTSTLMFFHSPLETIIKMILNLKEGTLFYNLWSEPPYDVFLKIYVFNITNPEEFLSGQEKMNVTELGPYVYRETLTHQNATFNDEDGTITYHPDRKVEYDAERSVSDPKEDHIMTTNILLVGLQSFLSDKPYFTNLGFSTIVRSLGQQPILNLTVHDYLFGYKDVLVRYAHKFVPSWVDFKTISIFDRLMSRDNGNTITVVKEPSKYHSKVSHMLTEEERQAEFHVVRFNELAGLRNWGYRDAAPAKNKKCQLVEGVFDGTVFPRNIPVNKTFNLFRPAFCRPVPLKFIQEMKTKDGFDVHEYKLADDMFDIIPENECFCYQKKCVKGFQSIAPCYYGIPITLSQPHYFNADPKILETVNGLSPDEELHGSKCTIQPNLGVPISGNMRIQINLEVGETVANPLTKNFNNLQVPLFWIEITTEDLPFIVVFLLHLVIGVLPVAIELVKYLLLLVGLALISASALLILIRVKPSLPRSLSLPNTDYVPLPIISLSSEFIEKCEKRFSLKH